MKLNKRTGLSLLTSTLFMLCSLYAGISQAAIISTDSALQGQLLVTDRNQLIANLNQVAVQEQLSQLGVDSQQLESRIASLTQDELAQLNERLKDMPAGEGAAGIILTVLLVLLITDLLCVTNVFNFIGCINR